MTDDGPYARFVGSADVATWAQSLDELVEAAAGTTDPQRLPGVLADGLCVAYYLQWLARVSGDLATMARAREQFATLRLRVPVAPVDAPAWRRCHALLLLSDGYGVQAAELLGPDGIDSPEIAVLMARRDDVKKLMELRGLVRGAQPTTFLPAVFEYTWALINVGGIREAEQVLTAGDWDDDEPILIELWSGIHERLGQWSAADDAYLRSRWPVHRYRAAVVGTIVGRPDAAAGLVIDDGVREVLLQVGGEMDQSELARSTAFLNACLWRPAVNWLLEFELSKMSFRRRQFAEADVHAARALSTAPRNAEYPIAVLRFTNATWLAGAEPHRQLDMLPEAIAAGYEAMALGDDRPETADVRVWLARNTNDLEVVPASSDGWTPHHWSEALEVVGDTPRAIDSLVEAVATAYYHRTPMNLIRYLYRAGLTQTVAGLAEIVLRESNDDVLALWETCLTLQDLLGIGVQVTDDEPGNDGYAPDADSVDAAFHELKLLSERYRERLLELSRFEFRNALRTHQAVGQAGYEDVAEELLLRAARQAERVSELLAVAVLRRTGLMRSVHSDQEAMRCLTRARGLARDRLERLEIARELLHHGAVRDGRGILAAEGVFSAPTPLTPGEMVVALQCAPWLRADECAELALRAARRLTEAARAGDLGPDPYPFAARLTDTLEAVEVPPPLLQRVRAALEHPSLARARPPVPWPGTVSGRWADVRSGLELLVERGDTRPDGEATGTVTEQFDALCADTSFGVRLLAVTRLRDHLSLLQDELRRVTPYLPDQEIPVARWYGAMQSPRVIRLGDLWRARLMGDEHAADALREFHSDERTLTDRWEQSRRDAGAPVLWQIVRAAEALGRALTTLVDADDRQHTHPVLRDMFVRIERDAARLVRDADEQAATARELLAQTTADVVAEGSA